MKDKEGMKEKIIILLYMDKYLKRNFTIFNFID